MSMPNTNDVHQANENSGRDARGRFAPGNPGGPGNPFARQVAALRQALVNSVTEEDIQEVMQSLKQQAKEGNWQAAKLFLQYVVGKPQPAPEPDRMDADEWQCHQQAVVMKAESGSVTSAGDPEFHLKTVRVMRPSVTEMMHREIMAVVNESPEDRKRREDADAAWCQRVLDQMNAARRAEEAADADPSPNVHNGHADPSPNVDFGAAPSPNGKKRRQPAPPPDVAAGNGRFVVG